MAIADPIQNLLAHDRWATSELLNSCATLSDAQLDQPFTIGLASVHKTMLRLLNVILSWQAALPEAGEPRDLPESVKLEDLKSAHRRLSDSFKCFASAALQRHSLHARKGTRSATTPPAAIIIHVLTQGTHHRAQALNTLRRLGVTRLQKSSMLQWMFETGVAH